MSLKLKPAPDTSPASLEKILKSDAPTPLAKPPVLSSKRLSEPTQVARYLRASIESGTSWSRVLDGSYWKGVSGQLRAGDIIECVEDTLKWYGKVIVTKAFGHHIAVAPLD